MIDISQGSVVAPVYPAINLSTDADLRDMFLGHNVKAVYIAPGDNSNSLGYNYRAIKQDLVWW